MNANAIAHPTENKPEHVIMLLLGETKRQYADILSVSHKRPFPAEAEVWTCNAGFRVWDHDLLFVMDDLPGEAHKWPGYTDDLAEHDKPILTSAVYPGYGHLYAYPFWAVCEALGLVGLDRYFYNTVPFMIAYALAIGVKKITIFGADYYHPNNPGREADLANAEWWLGFARGRGVLIELASDTTLMRARENRALYGYRFDPRISMDRALAAQRANENTPGSVAYDAPSARRGEDLSPQAAAFVAQAETGKRPSIIEAAEATLARQTALIQGGTAPQAVDK